MTTVSTLPLIRALLIEDEYLARQELRYLLREAHPGLLPAALSNGSETQKSLAIVVTGGWYRPRC